MDYGDVDPLWSRRLGSRALRGIPDTASQPNKYKYRSTRPTKCTGSMEEGLHIYDEGSATRRHCFDQVWETRKKNSFWFADNYLLTRYAYACICRSPFHCDQVQPLRLKEIQDGSQCDLGNGKVWVEADKITHTTEHSPPTLYNPGFGSVPQGLLKGVAVAVLWPPEKWSLMQRKDDD